MAKTNMKTKWGEESVTESPNKEGRRSHTEWKENQVKREVNQRKNRTE